MDRQRVAADCRRPEPEGRTVIATAKPRLNDDALVVVVDPTEPADVDRFLDALDRIVERRLAQRRQKDQEGTPPVVWPPVPSSN
jgi:hypothetical protein